MHATSAESSSSPPTLLASSAASSSFSALRSTVAAFKGPEFVAGCMAGCTASIVGQPLDTVRVRVQTRPPGWFTGAHDALIKTVRHEGVRSLFRGFAPPLIGMGPKNAMGFAVHGAALRVIEGSSDDCSAQQTRRQASLVNVMAAGTVAGLAQCLVVVPSDRIKIQLQMQGRAMHAQGGAHARGKAATAGLLNLGSARRCVSALVRADGMRSALFRGWWPTVARQAPACAVYFSSFEAFKRQLGSSTAATAVAGGLAGCMGYLCTYPLDVMKTAAQAAPPGTESEKLTMRALVRQLRAEHGPRWIVRGMGPTLARGFVLNAVNFVMFEWMEGLICG